jgi:hypothetical protein
MKLTPHQRHAIQAASGLCPRTIRLCEAGSPRAREASVRRFERALRELGLLASDAASP